MATAVFLKRDYRRCNRQPESSTRISFVPLKGARVDGHTFIPQVMEQGALATLTEEDPSSLTCPCIHVESCEKSTS